MLSAPTSCTHIFATRPAQIYRGTLSKTVRKDGRGVEIIMILYDPAGFWETLLYNQQLPDKKHGVFGHNKNSAHPLSSCRTLIGKSRKLLCLRIYNTQRPHKRSRGIGGLRIAISWAISRPRTKLPSRFVREYIGKFWGKQ